jgi:hypothetical protein
MKALIAKAMESTRPKTLLPNRKGRNIKGKHVESSCRMGDD